MLRARNAYSSVILVFFPVPHTGARARALFKHPHSHSHPLSSTPSIAHDTAPAITLNRSFRFSFLVARGGRFYYQRLCAPGPHRRRTMAPRFSPFCFFGRPFPFPVILFLRSYFIAGCWLRFLRVVLPPRLP